MTTTTDHDRTPDHARHTPYSDPGRHADLIAAIDPDPAAIHAVAWNTILHYRANGIELSDEQRADIDRRWLSALLDAGQERAPGPLGLPRDPHRRLAGCCRDHTLLAVAVFRQHGIPARSRVGFAGYFAEGFHHDHVVAEYWNGDRWVRFDPELDQGHVPFDAYDLPTGPGAPFQTAAEVWRQIRAGTVDPAVFGVDPSMPMLCGSGLVRDYVITELAHRMGDEVLLWDLWGTALDAIEGRLDGAESERTATLTDVLAELLVSADGGDGAAEGDLATRYARDPGLAPGGAVTTVSPTGRRGRTDLITRTTVWESAAPHGFTVPMH